MKKIMKVLVFLVIVCTSLNVLAKDSYKADKIDVTIKNIDDNIEYIELYYYKGQSTKSNHVSYDKLELIKKYSSTEIIDNTFNFTISKNKIRDKVTNIGDNYNNEGYVVRFYKDKRNTRDIICGNSSIGEHNIKPIFTTKKVLINYQNNNIKVSQGFNINVNNLKDNIFNVNISKLFIYLLLVVLIPIILQIGIAYIMKFNNISKIISLCFIEQLIFHLLLILMYLFFNSLIINTDALFLLFLVVLVLLMIFSEYKILNNKISEDNKKKVLIYSIIINVIRVIPLLIICLFIKSFF